MTTLRNLRQRLGMTQAELGRAIGRSLAAVQRWEKDEAAGGEAPRIALLATWAVLQAKERRDAS